MLNYATVGSNRLEDAKHFYDELLGMIGMTPMIEHGSGGRIYSSPDGRLFGVLGPFDGKPATAGNGSMFGFMLDSREMVEAFHAKALELGGTCEGEPGLRGPEEAGNFAAYFRDLDGNKLCAISFGKG
jgi:catechol 2,3-dioxygenase-like lactoylglutathione lyase family enzyme